MSIITSSPHDADEIPMSVPIRPDQVSLCYLPAELRLEILNHVLDSSNIPASYGYTGLIPESTQDEEQKAEDNVHLSKPLAKHGMLLASKQLSAEYRQCFYERTTFFLRIDSTNAFRGCPGIARERLSFTRPDTWQVNPGPKGDRTVGSGIPTFWNAPQALLGSLRHCTIFIELGNIAEHPMAAHSVSKIAEANTSLSAARAVKRELQSFSSHAEAKAQDSSFDFAIIKAIMNLLSQMHQLRSMQLVWDLTLRGTRSSRATSWNTNWSWNLLGQPFLAKLKRCKNLRDCRVKVGDRYGDVVHVGERGEGGVWTERIEGVEDTRGF